MSVRFLLSLTACASILILATHMYALAHDTYFYLPWFDIPMHLFGGFTVGLLGMLSLRLYFDALPRDVVWLLVLLFVLAIGALWEVFEMYLNITYQFDRFSLIDTIADLVHDMVGGIVALLVTRTVFTYEK